MYIIRCRRRLKQVKYIVGKKNTGKNKEDLKIEAKVYIKKED